MQYNDNSGGRFDRSWIGGGTNPTGLSNWLDPGNSGAITTNTTNIAALIAPVTATLSISGASQFCTGSSTYTLNGAPAGSTITWQTSNGNIGSIPPPPYGNTVTVTKTGIGTITLTATVRGNCIRVTKTIQIGTNSSFTVSGPSSSCPNQTQYYSTNAPVGNITWSWPSGWTYQSGQNSTLLTIITGNTSGSVSVSVPTACGSTTTASTYTQINTSSCGFRITATPNPTTDNVTVAVAEQKDVASVKTNKAMMYQIKVTDQLGNVKKQYKYSSGTGNASISLSGLISGIYTIQAFDGIAWRSTKVIKQ